MRDAWVTLAKRCEDFNFPEVTGLIMNAIATSTPALRLLRARRERPRGRATERGYHFPPSVSDRHVALPSEGCLVKGTISLRGYGRRDSPRLHEHCRSSSLLIILRPADLISCCKSDSQWRATYI
jgi:hypothetical protein